MFANLISVPYSMLPYAIIGIPVMFIVICIIRRRRHNGPEPSVYEPQTSGNNVQDSNRQARTTIRAIIRKILQIFWLLLVLLAASLSLTGRLPFGILEKYWNNVEFASLIGLFVMLLTLVVAANVDTSKATKHAQADSNNEENNTVDASDVSLYTIARNVPLIKNHLQEKFPGTAFTTEEGDGTCEDIIAWFTPKDSDELYQATLIGGIGHGPLVICIHNLDTGEVIDNWVIDS